MLSRPSNLELPGQAFVRTVLHEFDDSLSQKSETKTLCATLREMCKGNKPNELSIGVVVELVSRALDSITSCSISKKVSKLLFQSLQNTNSRAGSRKQSF